VGRRSDAMELEAIKKVKRKEKRKCEVIIHSLDF
jgi:hypothetical protein